MGEDQFDDWIFCVATVTLPPFAEKDVARTDRTLKFFAGDDNPNLAMLHNVLMTYCMYDFDLGEWEISERKY